MPEAVTPKLINDLPTILLQTKNTLIISSVSLFYDASIDTTFMLKISFRNWYSLLLLGV